MIPMQIKFAYDGTFFKYTSIRKPADEILNSS